MAVPRSAHMQARRTAHHHVQVRVTHVELPKIWPDKGVVVGRVTRVFRSRGVLTPDDPVSFSVCMIKRGQLAPPSAGGWIVIDELTVGRVIEIYLNGGPPDCETVEYTLLDGPTEQPQLRIE